MYSTHLTCAYTIQLSTACTARQCLSQTLEDERREGVKARTEIKELTVRLQGMKAVMQVLVQSDSIDRNLRSLYMYRCMYGVYMEDRNCMCTCTCTCM